MWWVVVHCLRREGGREDNRDRVIMSILSVNGIKQVSQRDTLQGHLNHCHRSLWTEEPNSLTWSAASRVSG